MGDKYNFFLCIIALHFKTKYLKTCKAQNLDFKLMLKSDESFGQHGMGAVGLAGKREVNMEKGTK